MLSLPLVRFLLWMIAAVVIAIARVHPEIHRFLLVISSGLTVDRFRQIIAPWGPWAAGASILIMVVQTFLPLPADLLIMANGAAFGIWEGLVVSIIGAVLSGCVAFGLGRILGRGVALRIMPASLVDWVGDIAAHGAWMAVLLLQFIPLIPFSLLNFLLGLTRLSWMTFLWTLAASILPADVILVMLGRGVGEGHSAVPWALAALGLLTIASVTLRSRLARVWQAPQMPPVVDRPGRRVPPASLDLHDPGGRDPRG
ncbi:MAG TPA: VTT domain-containing protein [bacterium]|nr:VTT domain-containing protein [bacterium]